MKRYCNSVVVLSVFVLTGIAGGTQALEFVRAHGFPTAAQGSYGINMGGLADGRLLVWDGDTVYLQERPPVFLGEWVGVESFTAVAAGYKGDPAFVAVSPDGHTVVLGAGYSNKLYRFDANDPQDSGPESLITVASHYSGVFLSSNLLLLDGTTDDYSTCRLAIVDIAAKTPDAKTVMLKPLAADLGLGEFAASALVAVNAARTTAYAMAVVYDSSFAVVGNQLRSIPVADLVNAFNTGTPLLWTAATAIGGPSAFHAGGPAGVLPNEDLLIGGFGGVQRVNPATAAVAETYTPAGIDYYGVGFNAVTGVVFPIVADPSDYSMDVVYAPRGSFAALPVTGAAGLSLLLAMIAMAGIWRTRFC